MALFQRFQRNDNLVKVARQEPTASEADDNFIHLIVGLGNVGKEFEEIFAHHNEENSMFYLDVSLEETMRRHETRVVSGPAFDAKKMKSWYSMAHRSNHRLEHIITEDSSLEESLDYIVRTAKFK